VDDRQRTESLALSTHSPGQVRSLLSELAADWRIAPDAARRAEILASEIVTDAYDHGSDMATLRICLEDEKLELELFDGPRRSSIATTGRTEGVPAMRMRVVTQVADVRYSSSLGDGHYARYEVSLDRETGHVW
jgi:hypothetical protein